MRIKVNESFTNSGGSRRPALALIAAVYVWAAAMPCEAQILFSDNFDSYSTPSTVIATATTNGYKIVFGPSTSAVDFKAVFGFDYSTVTTPTPIPSAPNSTGGTTKGLLLTVNKDATGAAAAVNLYPTNAVFSGNFALKFDMWINWQVPATSTEHALFGINHTGNVTNRVAQTGSDGLFFAVDGDGGVGPTSTASRDYSVFRGGGTAAPVLMLTNNTTFGPTPPLGPQFDNANPGFQTLFGASGAAGQRWVVCEVRQETNVITWSMDGTIVAQFTNTTVYSSGDIMLGYNDTFASIGDNADFVIFDNVSVTNLGGPALVSASNSGPVANEAGPVSGQFTLTRAGNMSSALTVNYEMSGTASNGVDYTLLPGTVTFAAGDSATNIVLAPIDDNIPERVETATLTVVGGTDYVPGAPPSATIAIIDNEPPAIAITPTQPILLEGYSGSKATDTLTRFGLTNGALTINLAYSGTATLGTDFNGPASVNLAAGAVTATVTMTPIDDDLLEGTETIIASVASGTGYSISTPASATNSITDDEVLPGLTLFADSFDSTGSGMNWAVNPSSGDTFAEFGYDYSADGIPEAPSSRGGFSARRGLKFRANETAAALAGISASPTNIDFGSSYRLLFDMWLNYSGPLNSATVTGSTQAGTAGVGTTGAEPMWPGGTATDGIWFSATGDGGSAAASGDYNGYVTMTLAFDATGYYSAGTTGGPRDNLNAYYAPWSGVNAPSAQLALRPSQTGTTPVGSFGMAWQKCAVIKRGNIITWDVAGRRIATIDASTFSLSTNVFVGYHDPFVSVTTNAAVQFGLFDNVRVETLGRPKIVSLAYQGANVVIDFLTEDGDSIGDFEVQASAAPGSGYAPTVSTINQVAPTLFEATTPSGGGAAFFRVKRL